MVCQARLMQVAESITTLLDNSSGLLFVSVHVADGRINKRNGNQETTDGEMQI